MLIVFVQSRVACDTVTSFDLYFPKVSILLLIATVETLNSYFYKTCHLLNFWGLKISQKIYYVACQCRVNMVQCTHCSTLFSGNSSNVKFAKESRLCPVSAYRSVVLHIAENSFFYFGFKKNFITNSWYAINNIY